MIEFKIIGLYPLPRGMLEKKLRKKLLDANQVPVHVQEENDFASCRQTKNPISNPKEQQHNNRSNQLGRKAIRIIFIYEGIQAIILSIIGFHLLFVTSKANKRNNKQWFYPRLKSLSNRHN
jgi:hypothetical protein